MACPLQRLRERGKGTAGVLSEIEGPTAKTGTTKSSLAHYGKGHVLARSLKFFATPNKFPRIIYGVLYLARLSACRLRRKPVRFHFIAPPLHSLIIAWVACIEHPATCTPTGRPE
jgi:hypothetical protein